MSEEAMVKRQFLNSCAVKPDAVADAGARPVCAPCADTLAPPANATAQPTAAKAVAAIPAKAPQLNAQALAQEALLKCHALTPRPPAPADKTEISAVTSLFSDNRQSVLETKAQALTRATEKQAHALSSPKPAVLPRSETVNQKAVQLRQCLIAARVAQANPSDNHEALPQRHASLPAMATTVAIGAARATPMVANMAAELGAALGRTALMSTAGPILATLAVAVYPAKVGEGSDKVPGGKYFPSGQPAVKPIIAAKPGLHSVIQPQSIFQATVPGRQPAANDEKHSVTSVKKAQVAVQGLAASPTGLGIQQCLTPSAHTGNPTQSVNLLTANTYSGVGKIDLNHPAPQLETGNKLSYVMSCGPQDSTGVVVKNNVLPVVPAPPPPVAVQNSTSDAAKTGEKGAASALDKAATELQEAVCFGNKLCVAKLILDGTAGSTTETLPVAVDLTGNKLENPIPAETMDTVLTTPDQRGEQGARHTGNLDGKPDAGRHILTNPGADPLAIKDLVYLSEQSSSKIENILTETVTGKKNFTSPTTLTTDEALAAGLKFLGPNYKEIGKTGSGVYHSADGTKEFRIDSGSISGAHAPGIPHVHFGVKDPLTGKYISNNHVPYKD